MEMRGERTRLCSEIVTEIFPTCEGLHVDRGKHMSIKSYRGEKIIAGLTARLEPPDTRYPDSFCKLILTKRRLYILEDNYNGTYNTLFVFSVQGIQNMQAQLKGLKYNRTVLGELFTNGIMTLFGGITNFSGKKKEEDIRFVITYDEGMGEYKK